MRTSHDSEATEAPGEEEDEEVDEAIYITGMTVPYFAYEITGWILAQVRERWVLCVHSTTSGAVLAKRHACVCVIRSSGVLLPAEDSSHHVQARKGGGASANVSHMLSLRYQ